MGVHCTHVTTAACKVLLGVHSWFSGIVRPALLRHEKAGDSHQKPWHRNASSPFS